MNLIHMEDMQNMIQMAKLSLPSKRTVIWNIP